MSTISFLQDVSLYNSITAASGIQATTATFLSGVGIGTRDRDVTKTLHIVGDVLINGTLSALKESYFVNTLFTTTSALSVLNSGTGPAIVATQTGEQAVMALYDDAAIALYVDGKTGSEGYVGVKTETPNVELTVNGRVSASGMVYGSNILNRLTADFGNGVDTTYNIAHTYGHSLLVVSIIDNSTKEVVYPSVTYTDNTKVTVSFSRVPGTDAFRAIIIG